ncbi:hypothetical protein [Melissococcus plutonius]|uniref:hypothetical protein n=1 Tax=Melissococcus plutonius TaxID=33970 RepID=UPI00128D3E08|nr:hypothetical protein [Melissococcus plutonius]
MSVKLKKFIKQMSSLDIYGNALAFNDYTLSNRECKKWGIIWGLPRGLFIGVVIGGDICLLLPLIF